MGIDQTIYLIAPILTGILASISLTSSPILGFLATIIGPLTGALFGVIFGFKVNDNKRKNLDKKRRLFFKNLLLHEIDKSIELLEDKDLNNLMPIDGWNSLVNSGDIALFDHNNLVTHLCDVYFLIEDFNYEVDWIWQHKYAFDEKGDVMDQERPQYVEEQWVKPLLEKLKVVKNELNDFEK